MKVYMFLADGFETVEALAPIDVFRRAGVEIHTVSISGNIEVTSSHDVVVEADCLLEEIDITDGDALILPGGYPGYVNLAENEVVGQPLRTYYDSGRFVAAICGAPTVLQRYGVAKGSRVAVHHGCVDEMKDYVLTGHDVEQDRHLITASGAGHAVEFALALLYALQGERKVAHVKEGMELH